MSVNIFDTTLTDEQLIAHCNLTDAEARSLLACPAHDQSFPPEGNRTAYVKRRLKSLHLVEPLWCSDDVADELFFTWRRTVPGDRLAYLASLAGKSK